MQDLLHPLDGTSRHLGDTASPCFTVLKPSPHWGSIHFFAAIITNPNTRDSYDRVVSLFLDLRARSDHTKQPRVLARPSSICRSTVPGPDNDFNHPFSLQRLRSEIDRRMEGWVAMHG